MILKSFFGVSYSTEQSWFFLGNLSKKDRGVFLLHGFCMQVFEEN